MLSKIYPSLIRYQQNPMGNFVSDCLSQQNTCLLNKPFNPNHPSIPKYSKAISKLFNQISFSQQNLWIFPLNGTPTVEVYFSGNSYLIKDPQFYPVSLCCQKCVYLQIEEDLSGSIICPNCKIILVSFIHYEENPFKDGKITQVQKQRLFKQKKRQNLTKNKLMGQNLTSHRYKNKDLKKVLSNCGNQSSSNLINSNKQSSFVQIQNAKDGFILEMKTQISRFNQNNQERKYVSKSPVNKFLVESSQFQKSKEKTNKTNLNMKSIEETKNIILDIFK